MWCEWRLVAGEGSWFSTEWNPKVFFSPGLYTFELDVYDPYSDWGWGYGYDYVTVRVAAMELTALSRTSAYAGAGPVTITVSGSGFKRGAVVATDYWGSDYWGRVALPTTFLSSTMVRAVLPAGQLAAGRVLNVEVVNPDGSPSTTLPFTVLNRVPAIYAIAPVAVNHGSPDFTLTVSGDRFASGAQIVVNGQPRWTWPGYKGLPSTRIYASEIANPGRLTIQVANPAPGGGVSNAKYLTVR